MKDYIAASWGGLDILVATIDTTGGRDIVVQSPARGDKHVLQDRGLRVKTTTCRLLFCPQPNKANYLVRYDAMRQASEDDISSVFSHPILGTYRARISEFNTSATDGTEITVSCTIIAEEEPQVVFRTGAGVSLGAGVESVNTAVGFASATLAELGITLEPDVAAESSEAVTAWSQAEDLDAQKVFVEVATLTGQIDDAINALNLATNIENWEAYKAMILLRYQLGRAAEAATSDAEHVFDLVVAVGRPLIAICSETYGASLATDRADSIAKLNRLRTPGLVPAGTTLKMISEGARA